MRVLFVHQALPAQFGRLALELHERYGWTCEFIVENLTACPSPTPAMLEKLVIHRMRRHSPNASVAWPQAFAAWIDMCKAVHDVARREVRSAPDLIVAHGGRGPMALFLPELFRCPVINYCEYYFAHQHCDLTYRIDLPHAEPAPFFPRVINAPVLLSLLDADAGYSPTHWQRSAFPERLQHKIEVHFDGCDTELYQPRDAPRTIAGHVIPADMKVVTYVSRGLESMRGFDIFVAMAERVAAVRSDVLFVVAGGTQTHYGWDAFHTGGTSFKQWALARHDAKRAKFLFLDIISPEELANVLCLSDLHVYLTAPFVLSWSLFNAMSSARVVLGSDVPPVRELITDGETGLLAPFFDADLLADKALAVLADPSAHAPLARAARERMLQRYSMDVAIPALRDFFEKVARRGRVAGPSTMRRDDRRQDIDRQQAAPE